MYSSPFGSIFGDKILKPAAQPKVKDSELSPQDSLAAQTVDLKKSKIIAPNKQSHEEDKTPFSNTPAQFTALATMESDDPWVVAEQSKIIVEKNKQKLSALKRHLSDLQKKLKAARVYQDVLIQYKQLPKLAREELNGWLIQHAAAIKKLNAARKLKLVTKGTKESVTALDAEITHWENLLDLKEKGADLKGKTVFKNYRPIEKHVKATPPNTKELPKLGAKPSLKNIYKLKTDRPFAKASELSGGLGESAKAAFAAKLPGKADLIQTREAKTILPRLKKKTEQTIVRAKELDWRIERIKSEIEQTQKELDRVSIVLGELVHSVSADAQDEQTVNSLGILLEAKPERFLAAPTLLAASKAAFKRLSQLGQTEEDIQLTPEQEAEQLLQEAKDESEAALKDLEVRQNALTQVQAKVEDKPVPPPIVLVAKEQPNPPTAAHKINKLLPYIAGLFLLVKLLED